MEVFCPTIVESPSSVVSKPDTKRRRTAEEAAVAVGSDEKIAADSKDDAVAVVAAVAERSAVAEGSAISEGSALAVGSDKKAAFASANINDLDHVREFCKHPRTFHLVVASWNC